jgi:glycosyltransferase involved in cell wall biosynthesis
VVVNESKVADYIKDYVGANVRGLTVLPNGVDMNRLKPRLSRVEVRSQFSTPPEAGVVFFAGRLEEVKNLPFVLEVFSNLLKTVQPAPYLWLAGEGSQRRSLEQAAATLGIEEHVRFLGAREDLPEIYSGADVFIFPSLSEGLPNVVLEAMGSGLAVVVSETAGCQDFVRHGENGIILSGFETSDYEEAVRALLRSSEQRKNIAFQATSTIKELFGVDSMARQACEIYKALLESARES